MRETVRQATGVFLQGILASLGVTAVCLVLPEFSRPVMLSAILMLGVGNIELSLCSGLFFCSLLGLLCGGTIQEFSMYILLVLIGAVAADAVENSKKQFWYEWFAGMAGMLLPVLFYYLTYREISVRIHGICRGGRCGRLFVFASVLPEVSGCKKCGSR